MPRFFYIACDGIYGGLHGMCDYGVIDTSNEDDARNEAINASLAVINSYSDISGLLETDVEYRLNFETNVNFDELYEKVCYEDVEYSLWRIDENKAKDFSTEELNMISYSMGEEEFVKKFCIIEPIA